MPDLSLFDLSGRLALVTGSSDGIGLALAGGLGKAGARVVLNGREEAKLAAARDRLASQGVKVDAARFDVADRPAVLAAVERIEREIGAIDILVNNAGIQRRAPFEAFPEETWREVMAINIDGVFHVTQAVGKRMVERKRGRIINICSVTSELGRATIVPYATTKGALRQMTRGLSAEWAKHNMQINAIAPGYIRTPLNQALMDDEKFSAWVSARTPAGRWAEPDELIGAAIFLASEAASYVNGHVLYVDGGLSTSV
ncbi:MAG TPA: SDR family oxidoreductase [Roseiarcus sp.]|jgi:gluconate 5-dehydrogenase|nr:SDR family oxidoreductase [Roseiarcus sp.]